MIIHYFFFGELSIGELFFPHPCLPGVQHQKKKKKKRKQAAKSRIRILVEGVWSRNAPTLPATAVVQKAAAVVGAYLLIGLPCLA